jgi:Ca2+-binding RTX toxin-like protein
LTALSAALPSGATTLKTGATAQISLTFNENVTVTGAPTLQLSDGETATFVSGSGSNVLTFAYTASAGDHSSDLQVSGLNLTNGAKIADANGNSVGTLSGDLKISVAAAAPTVTSLSAVASGHTATLAEGQTATITVNLSEAVTVAGTPELQLSDWGVAKYVSGSGTNTLTFSYVGDPTQNTELHATGLVLPTGSSIQDSAGNALTTVTGDLGLWIASIQPYNLGITETTSTGTKYVHAGSTVTFTMTTTEAVTVAGKPTLTLNDGAAATYVSGSGTNTLTFSYLVQPGDTSKALGATGLSIGANASIVDAKGNPWNQQIGVFANTSIVVDTTPPTFVGVSLSPNAPTSVSTGQSEPLTVTLSEAVNVTGAPTLQLSDGESATYVSGSGTNSLTFSYSPTAGHATQDLQVTGLALPSGASIDDLAGNAVVGSLSGDLHLAVNEANAQIAYGTGVHDVFVLASQSEVVVEPAVNDGTAVLESSFSTTLPANITILKLEGTGNLTGTANNMNDFLYANSGNDVLVAEKGADTLVAGSGADTLVAGTGNDTMIGGSGADTFLFNKLVATQDVIQNFGAKDVINISTYLAAGLTPHLSDTAAGEIISFSNGASIELLGVHASQLVSTSVGYIHA